MTAHPMGFERIPGNIPVSNTSANHFQARRLQYPMSQPLAGKAFGMQRSRVAR